MKIVIHAGMHKTGSSAIQAYFSEYRNPDFKYARWTKGGNHSGLFVLLFQNAELISQYHGFKARGPEYCQSLPKLREIWYSSIEEDIRSAEGKKFIFSAEDISHPSLQSAVVAMADFFRQKTDDITVVAYVRQPLSFALSAFQQMLQGSDLRSLRLDAIWPQYKARFNFLDQVFGRNRVILRPYNRATLVGGDVVHDFASILDLQITAPPKTKANVTLSAEATALLYTQRRMGTGFVGGFDRAYAANGAFIDALRGIGTSKLTFADSLWSPVLEQNRADLEWIEERLGVPLHDTPTPDALAIASEEDLFRLAAAQQPALEAALLAMLRKEAQSPVGKTAATLEMLRRLSYEPYTQP